MHRAEARPDPPSPDRRGAGPQARGPARVPTLVAHRGWARRAPENTRAALAAAAEAGAPWVEVDVQLSSDGVPVLFHDRTLERLCGVPGAVAERTAAELLALPAPEPGRFGDRWATERIAPLAWLPELLARHRGLGAFVELKRAAIERFGHDAVLDASLAALGDALGRCVLISFDLEVLRRAAARGLSIGPVVERWDERGPALALAPAYLFCDLEGLPPAGPLDAGAARLCIYEVDRAEVALALAARGVELVETFAVGELLAALGEPAA